MAHYFSTKWENILIAFPLNILEFKRLVELAYKIKFVYILIDSVEAAKFLHEKVT